MGSVESNLVVLPFFSIIIPTYARPAQLLGCLESMARLDYPRDRLEVIVVDDGSSPPLEGAEEQFLDRLDVRVCRQENAGPASARNVGAAIARGEFLAFTDDDCAPERDWLLALASGFAKPGGPTVVGGKVSNTLTDNLFSSTSQAILDVVYAHFNADPRGATFFASNNLAIAAVRFREIGGFDETFRTSEDRELCNRLTHRGDVMVYAPEARIRHAHAMTLRGFWKQHFNYGRGAFRFHTLCARRGSGGLSPDFRFYGKLLLYPLSSGPLPRALGLATMIVVSQAASTAGFLYEYITGRETARGRSLSRSSSSAAEE